MALPNPVDAVGKLMSPPKWFLPFFSNFATGEQDPEKYRFQVELEFVQCLANPQYLNCNEVSLGQV